MRIAVIGAGAMGAALGGILVSRGAQVLSPLHDRSEASRHRAQAAGITDAGWDECAACDFMLSVVPPSQAIPVAERLRSALAKGGVRPIFLECNAIAPDTARAIAAMLEQAGCAVVDGGILGGPPTADGTRSPLIYLAGLEASSVSALSAFGLRLHDLTAPIGAASGLKMALAGISKGQTALVAIMLLLAMREGVAAPFLQQLENSQPAILAWGRAQVPQLGRKAGRWVEEMEILAEMTRDTAGAGAQFSSLGEFYTAVAGGDRTIPLDALMRTIAGQEAE